MAYTTLVSTAELAQHLGDPGWMIFDCRHDLAKTEAGRDAYVKSHIPGAFFMHLDRDLSGPVTGRNGRHPLPAPEVFASRLSACGVDESKQVVGYDDAGSAYAVRLWWMLRWLGHDQAAVLDGGWNKWTREGRPVTDDMPQAVKAKFKSNPRKNWVDAKFVESHLESAQMRLIDARTPERFRGVGETLDPVAGHIPGAENHFFKNNLDSQGCFKSAHELKQAFLKTIGETSPEKVVHQCGSGVTACHNLLAMEIAGLKGSRLYPGSWSEWCTDPKRPMTKGSY